MSAQNEVLIQRISENFHLFVELNEKSEDHLSHED